MVGVPPLADAAGPKKNKEDDSWTGSLTRQTQTFTPIHTVTAGFPLPINASFLMGPQDAVLWLGCTPPPVKYFSIRSYLAYRSVCRHQCVMHINREWKLG